MKQTLSKPKTKKKNDLNFKNKKEITSKSKLSLPNIQNIDKKKISKKFISKFCKIQNLIKQTKIKMKLNPYKIKLYSSN